ncbi:hypothetical protein V1264_000842 [Littorina saxatilis]
MGPRETLDYFHQHSVVPTDSETRKRNEDIDAFVRFLHIDFGRKPHTVAKVVKSGSLGKGTAVRGSPDIDLVVFLNGITSIENLVDKRKELLETLEETVSSYGPWRGRIKLEKRTPFFLCYTLDGQEVDILPACDVLAREGSPSNVYRKMASYPKGKEKGAQQYSVSLAPLQIEFVKPVAEDVKRVIRLVKLWKQEKGLKIPSYTVELITIHASRGMSPVTTNALFKEVMLLLQDCRSLRIAFNTHNYNSSDYARLLSPPYVLDPANPYMNTIYGVDEAAVSREAANTLRCL